MARTKPLIATLITGTAALALAGCSGTTTTAMTPAISSPVTASSQASTLTTGSAAPVTVEALARMGREWEAQPSDIAKGLAYAEGLESIGQAQQQADVYRKLAELNPGNTRVLGFYGRKLAALGRTGDAVQALELAAQGADADWRVFSALGSAYDQQGKYDMARGQYQRALAAAPGNLAVLNNLGMSYALQGNLKQAEATLRQAGALLGAKQEPRIRQNLALVVGLQGRFEEASAIAKDDLPPEQVEANMAYLRKMLSQPNTWQQISEGAQG